MTSAWRLEGELGRGTRGVVHAVVGPEGVRGALKIASKQHAAALAYEAERCWIADAPGMPRLLGAGLLRESIGEFPQSSPYLLFERVEGVRPLYDDGAAPLRAAFRTARDVGDALAALHGAGVAHGDVKPDNLIDDGVRVHLVDLGLAHAAEARAPRGGTPRYLAPELFGEAAGSSGRERDLWALGLTLAEISTPSLRGLERLVPAEVLDVVPAPLVGIIEPLLARVAGARPSAAWVAEHARHRLPDDQPTPALRERGLAALERSYLALRREEIAAAARCTHVAFDGAEQLRPWLARALERRRSIERLIGRESTPGRAAIAPLSSDDLTRWLVAIVGPRAMHFALEAWDEARLAARLFELAEIRPLEELRAIELVRRVHVRSWVGVPATDLALGLGNPRPDAALDAEAERRFDELGEAARVALVRRLRLRGETGRALALRHHDPSPLARAEAAETARRAGDPERAARELSGLVALGELDAETSARAVATRARLAYDAGDSTAALELTALAEPSAATLEVRALAFARLGATSDARREIARARALAEDPEARARCEGAAASFAHALGDTARALAGFAAAMGHAEAAGATLEEATWATGLAAAAAQHGALGDALAAARRAQLLFEAIDRPVLAARAALNRAFCEHALGALHDATRAADEALRLARLGGDQQCRAYAHLARCDLALSRADARGAADELGRATQLLGAAVGADGLRLAARALRLGAEVDIPTCDRSAQNGELEARLEWWHARLDHAESPDQATPLAGLATLAAERPSPPVAGPAFAAAAAAAARAGDARLTDLFDGAVRIAAEALCERCGEALAERVRALPWVERAVGRSLRLAPTQLGDVEALSTALGRRDALSSVARAALDALVLWTGVERGLLLLSAPGGRLVPRYGRKLSREDLSVEERALSRGLAERARTTREPVVAVDAHGELAELHESVQLLSLRSVLAVPLLARGEVLGVVYLDDRVRQGAFGPRELAWVRLIASFAAAAIADARDAALLRRARRRAERAERRLAEELATREGELSQAERALSRLAPGRGTRRAYPELVGESAPVLALLDLLDRVAASDVPVLVVGESGTGKELVARALHDHGRRRGARFVAENCGALPESLLEATLFGHVRGAFTGAVRTRIGLFELADGGTLFLDEVGEMSPALQAKLLRVLETGELTPLGSERSRRVDVRVIAATHRDLPARVREGAFREDLLYRLDVMRLTVPPLRERTGDVPLLVRHFVDKHAPGRRVRFTAGAERLLAEHRWPGNVRQLENELRRALVLADEVIDREHFSPTLRGDAEADPEVAPLDLKRRVDRLEGELLREALARTGGNQTRAAELLGLSRFGLQKMMQRLGVATRKPEA